MGVGLDVARGLVLWRFDPLLADEVVDLVEQAEIVLIPARILSARSSAKVGVAPSQPSSMPTRFMPCAAYSRKSTV